MTVTQTISAPAATSAPPNIQFRLKPQGTWTYQDWLQFPEDGWKYEIINGELQIMPPPAVYHQWSSGELFVQMFMFVKQNNLGKVLEAPCGVKLPHQDVPVEPDIFFVKQERLEIIQADYVYGAPDLVVEIMSPSNPNYDRKHKFQLYQENGVLEYWLVNYWQKYIELFVLRDGVYQLQGKYDLGETISSEQLAGFELVVADIFNF
ncbi:Uma2 family endonuclease [Anaerolineales bacterium HSG6]|nr:Uma2 family endonuclease [Anaerolineales bacterium HSG6]